MKQLRTITGAAMLAATLLASPAVAQPGSKRQVKRGEYLVRFGGCGDCHTPLKMGPAGPERDLTRLLSGHPEELALPPPPTPAPGPWMAVVSSTMTAWAGPWGVSYAANLTPDAETGLGRWTLRNFVEAMRSGRHMGRGRRLLPPMPFENLQALGDDDLRAVYAYLRTLPAVRNRVPDPVAPTLPAAATASGSAGAR